MPLFALTDELVASIAAAYPTGLEQLDLSDNCARAAAWRASRWEPLVA